LGEIRGLHQERLEKVLKIVNEPHTTAEVSADLFKEVRGYNELLAIEEAGAHIEYLYQRGKLEIANLEEWAESEGEVAIKYKRLR
jgi:hypothetical protein